MSRLISATLLLLLIAGCSGGSTPPVQDIDPGPVDPGPALVEIAGKFTLNSNLLLPQFRLYFLGLRRLSDGWIVKSTAVTGRGTINFDYTDLYFDSYKVELLSYDPSLATLELRSEWQSSLITPSFANPLVLDLDLNAGSDTPLGSNWIAYDLYLNGDESGIVGDVFTGYRLESSGYDKLYQFLPGQWNAVFPFIVGPWDEFHFDFNNNGQTPELLNGIPEGTYIVGVYSYDPSNLSDLIVYGESTEAFTALPEVPTTGVAVHVDFLHPVIKHLP